MIQEFNPIFGCAHRETYIFKRQKVMGIIGLAMRKASHEPANLVYQYHQQKNNDQQTFNMCVGIKNGFFSINKNNENLHIKKSKMKKF